LRLFSFGAYGLALAALALVVFGAYDSYPNKATGKRRVGSKVHERQSLILNRPLSISVTLPKSRNPGAAIVS